MPRFGNLNDSSLQSLCLVSIVQHFHRYFCAFTASKDARLQRNMEFLQRRFSYELASELIEDGKETDEYFDFLINEHLTSVNLEWFAEDPYLKCFDNVFSRLPNLKKICFSCNSDAILKSVAEFCPKITEINAAEESDFSDDGIEYLCEMENGRLPCPELRKISAFKSWISRDGAERLIRSLPSIEIFEWEHLPYVIHSIYTKKGSKPKRQKIRHLNLTKLNVFTDEDATQYISEVLKTCLTVCPKLESLTCDVISQKEQLDEIMNSGLQLKELCLSFFERISNINLDNFLKVSGRSLTNFTIFRCTVSVSALAVHCPALKDFRAYYVNFTDDEDDLQLLFPALTNCVLTVESNTVAKAFSLISSSSPKLEAIRITGATKYDVSISDEIKNQILMWCKNSAAKVIMFHNVFIEMNFLRDMFSNFVSLTRMQLDVCRYDFDNPREIVHSLAKKHPNRPKVEIYGDAFRPL